MAARDIESRASRSRADYPEAPHIQGGTAVRRRNVLAQITVVCFMIGVIASPAFATDTGRKCVRIQGARVALGLVEKRVHAYAGEHPGFCAVVSGAQPADALEHLCEGSVDMAVTGRRLNDKERAGFCPNGVRIEQVLAGMAAPAVFTQLRNPVDSLTIDQMRKIFTGEYKNWADVGGLDRPIRVMAASPKRNLAAKMFQRFALRGKPFSPNAVLVGHTYGLLDMCARSKGYVIAVVPYAFYVKSRSKDKIKLLGISRGDGRPAVKPSQTTMRDGSYFLTKPMFICWNANADGSGALTDFASFNRRILAATDMNKKPTATSELPKRPSVR
jgi:phosphate transport system substrate-binding protein